MIILTQRAIPYETQQSQETDINAPGGIETRNPSKRAAADTRLKPLPDNVVLNYKDIQEALLSLLNA
jgi:hypothetical protein